MDNKQSHHWDEWPKIVETIANYEDEEFLNSWWCFDGCHDWFSSLLKDDYIKGYSWTDASRLAFFIVEHQLKDLLAGDWDAEWPALLMLYLQCFCDTISTMHKVERGPELGSGGFGKVFRGSAFIYNTKHEIALKRSLENSPHDALQREIEMLEKLESNPHQFLVHFFQTVTIDEIEYIAVELCDGNLNDYVQEWKKTDRPDIDRMVLGQIVVALQHLFRLNVVHKDLNPNNVLFKRTKCDVVQVKLADFGISKQTKFEKQDFSTTKNKGTRGYISPELLRTGKPSFESDIWALGAVVYFVTSKGDHPYYIEDFNLEFVNVLVEKLKLPPKVGDLPDWSAADLVRSLMAYESEKRPHICLVLLHPYFSAANEKTRLHLARAVNEFYRHCEGTALQTKFDELYSESHARSWYEHLDTDWMPKSEDENFLQLISKAFAPRVEESDNIKDSDGLVLGSKEERIDVLTRIRQDISSQLIHLNLIERTGLYGTEIMKLLAIAPNLFAHFFWHVLTCLTTEQEVAKTFQVSQWFFTMYHCSTEFYIEMSEQRREKEQRMNSDWPMKCLHNVQTGFYMVLSEQRMGQEEERMASAQLRYASMTPDTEIIKYLLYELKANVDDSALEDLYWTPLHFAAHCNSNAEVVKLLIEGGANPNALDFKKRTPLHYAALFNSNAEVVKMLIEGGANPNAQCENNLTPLHFASYCNSNATDISRLLIVAGAVIDTPGNGRCSPLHGAAMGNPDIGHQRSKSQRSSAV